VSKGKANDTNLSGEVQEAGKDLLYLLAFTQITVSQHIKNYQKP